MSGKTIVIAGAGYGGLAAARGLADGLRHARVILIDQRDYHLLQFQLHQAAVNKIDTETLARPLRELLPLGVEFLQARITRFDFEEKTVHTDQGAVRYDRLIIALGGQTTTYNIPGLDEHALPLKSLRDARRIRGHLVMTLAARPHDAPRPYPIVVGGAGITGVELAAELAEGLPGLARDFALAPHGLQVMLLEAAPTILPGFDAATIAEATSALKHLNVDVRTGTRVEQVEANRIIVNSNGMSEVIETGTLVWTGGVQANWLVSKSGLRVGQRGAAIVDEHLRAVDHSDVSVIGDSALVRDPRNGQAVLPCGQLALHQGWYVARDLLAEWHSQARPPYLPHTDGLLISLGEWRGVGYVGPLWVRRLIARAAKSAAELRYLYTIGGVGYAIRHGLWLQHDWVGLTRNISKLVTKVSNLKRQISNIRMGMRNAGDSGGV